MALTTDAEFLIHMMRVKFLRMDDRGERIMAFPPTVMSDDYVRLAAPCYPEMQYCYSPAYDLTAKDNPIFGTGTSSGLITSPRTKRTHYRSRKTGMNTMNDDNNNGTVLPGELKLGPTTKSPSGRPTSRMDSSSDSDDDVDGDYMTATKQLQQRPLESTLRNFKSQEDTSTIISQGGASELTTTASLQPSMESNIDPSPRSSLDVIDTVNTHENSLPFMQVASVAPRASLDTSRYTKNNNSNTVLSPPPIPPPKMTTTTESHPLPPPPPSISSLTMANRGPSILTNRKQQQQQQQQQQQTSSIPALSLFYGTPDISPNPSPPPQQQQTRRLHIIPGRSTLTAMIAAKATAAENPFAAYSHASGKGSSHPMTLCVYLPHSSTPYEPVSLVVRPDAIIDDVIGYILYDYVEQKRGAELDQELYDLAQWVLLIAEDDGEIEDELPALDRTRKIDKVSFDQFALCRANPSQAKENEQTRAKLGRFKPDLESFKKKPSMAAMGSTGITSATTTTTTTNSTTTSSSAEQSNVLHIPVMTKVASGSTSHSASSNGDPMIDSANLMPPTQLDHNGGGNLLTTPTAGVSSTTTSTIAATLISAAAADADSSSIAVPVPSSKAVLTKAALPMTPIKYFRIRLMTSEEVAATTTIPVYAEMFIGDVLELVSRKRKLDPNEYILTLPDSNMVISNDTAVESLNKDVEELTLTKKTSTLTVPHSSSNPLWRSPIKKRKEDPHSPMYFNTGDDNKQPSDNFLQQYKKYNVNRKTPMFVGKRVSVLAIDGNYIHLMPPEHKGMFDSVKTTSFHISAIRSCKQSKKVPSNFKIGVMKERDNKTYELEAETSKEAYEICARIRFLIQMNKGSGT
ncbi:stress-activated map kinase interacting protein 1-domain-containing protein [Chlamydoabsidia padenii]|nr:stress-activated map kinase interacting protein 1-domain-containing protein [Chlamydoabsidia padenii]